eukprot:CAMPEP_0184529072 /NCGR_PEP_ID=MMETSP0198_2-20121128/12165_1 /TAXON_ID=1112570 /ORGANISM="Thraustochytrium sp., Strain LLF1b" /LENGTH=295 /DNA_ID=CAMNT_0026921031 /DNA_START=40 /DNA_END=927 /DNA_ORIENTATION=-
MATDTSRSGPLSLHPLVLVNISDHFSRAKQAKEDGDVVGILLGCQIGRAMHIYDSYEIPRELNEDSSFKVDIDFVTDKVKHFTEVFPSYELLGWYTIGSEVQPRHLDIHRSVCTLNENPLLLMIGTDITSETKELPVKMYESVMQMANDVPRMIFVDLEFHIEATEPERITVDKIIKGSTSQGSSLEYQLGDLHNSVSMLSKKMRGLLGVLERIKRGEIPMDHEFLREISTICNRLPVVDSEQFEQDFNTEMDDALLVTLMAKVTNGVNSFTSNMSKKDRNQRSSKRAIATTMLR